MGHPSRGCASVDVRDLLEALPKRLELAEHPTAVGGVAENRLLLDPVALSAGALDALQVASDRLGESVARVKPVREVEERAIERLAHAVPSAELDRTLEQS